MKESALQTKIVKRLKENGWFVTKLISTSTPGICDLMAIRKGTVIMLEVKTDNLEAIGLYEALGYSKLNVRKDYFGSGLDAQVMRLELS